jgi:hypothetical protein
METKRIGDKGYEVTLEGAFEALADIRRGLDPNPTKPGWHNLRWQRIQAEPG